MHNKVYIIGLEEFRRMLDETKRPGLGSTTARLFPGLPGKKEVVGGAGFERDMRQVAGMIDAMTPDERRQPGLIHRKRCKRIAVGAGVEPGDVMKLVNDFAAMQEVMRRIGRM